MADPMLPDGNRDLIELKSEGVIEETDCSCPTRIRRDQLIIPGESKVWGLDVGDELTDLSLFLEVFAPV